MHRLLLFQRFKLTQPLHRGICAVALVASLLTYQKSVFSNPQVVAQRHWSAIANQDPNRATAQYSQDAVVRWMYGSSDRIYEGQEIYQAWKNFFVDYSIQDYQVIKQEQRDRSVSANIIITAKPQKAELRHESIAVFAVSYNAQIDEHGKIIREIWHTNSELNV